MKWIEDAKDCPVLKGLDSNEIQRVFGKINFQVKTFDKGASVAAQGDEVRYFMILLKGSVRGEMTNFSGRVLRIEDVKAPGPVAGAFLFGESNKFPVDIIANEDVRIMMIYREELLKLLSLNSDILRNYLDLVSSRVQFLSNKIRFLSYKSIKCKMAHYLSGLKNEPGGFINIPVSQKTLAGLFGVARPSVARALKELELEGIIKSRNRKVEILDHDALVRLMNE